MPYSCVQVESAETNYPNRSLYIAVCCRFRVNTNTTTTDRGLWVHLFVHVVLVGEKVWFAFCQPANYVKVKARARPVANLMVPRTIRFKLVRPSCYCRCSSRRVVTLSTYLLHVAVTWLCTRKARLLLCFTKALQSVQQEAIKLLHNLTIAGKVNNRIYQ